MPSCPHRPPCPGCPRFGERDIDPFTHEALNKLARAHGLPAVSVVRGQRAGFRLRARLAIRGRMGSPKLGLFELNSHRVVHIPNCMVQHPLINRVAAVVRGALIDSRVSSYSDAAHWGIARYLQVVVERSSQTAQVVIVANCETVHPMAECLDLIRQRLGSQLHSLWFNANCGRSNVIMGPDFQHWHGPASVVEYFGGTAVHYPPGAFGQNNLDIAERIIEHIREQIPPGAQVAEFYAGVGAIGLSMLGRISEIRMNEISAHSLHGLELGVAALSDADRAKVSVFSGQAAATRRIAADAQVVIADPPRKGLDTELTRFLAEQSPERFIYVSCATDSFLSDTEALLSRGTLRLAGLTAFDLLPYTAHVETVARFDHV